MGYRSLQACVDDLAASGQLVRIESEVDAHLDCAEIHRRVCAAGGPALLFNNVRNCRFPLLSNLFGTIERARYLFRDQLGSVQQLVQLKIDPAQVISHPLRALRSAPTAWAMRPKTVRGGAVLANTTSIDQLPQQISWPQDGGPYITLPQVYTEDSQSPGWQHANLGMYRIQLAGNEYKTNQQVGLHYQIHRSIGVHHANAVAAGVPLKVNIFVGGPPAMTLAAVMPLPEGMSELTFAGALGGRRIRMAGQPNHLPIHADADFCITGTVIPDMLLPEGPFGDHLGYYSLAHPFPVLRVEQVYHRDGAIWPFTVVGRPPQEDTVFGELIHEITGPVIPSVLPGVHAVHAVDATGVHPLLLAIGSERYTPYDVPARPQELLTQASAILGQGQLSLAKWLLIANHADAPGLNINNVEEFLLHMLARADWQRDLHFHTQTTIDTLDYSGGALNQGSKLVIAAVGPARFDLQREIPTDLSLPHKFANPKLVLPGVLAVSGPAATDEAFGQHIKSFCDDCSLQHAISRFRWVLIADDSDFVAESLRNFLWVVFTRTNPAVDVQGIESFVQDKHWGCRGPLVIDARIKPHHAPPLEVDPAVSRHVDRLFASGGPLQKWDA